MKNLIPRIFLSGAVAVALAGVNAPQNSSAQTEPAPAAVSAAPVAPPPDIAPGSPLAQVVRLTQAGVDQSIIMTYVANSTGTFNLDSDRIIYLTDLGAPNGLITAMMQRDQQLQQQFTATPAAQPTQPAQPAPQTAPPSTTEVAPQPETQPAPVTVDYFNTTLSPYGSWVVVAGYGRCWRPTAAVYDSTWQPYCDRGQWVYTDCGWYWNSSYAWGATFHYGRWFRDASVGWCWYPDTVWAPSWVTWRYSDNYCGWAPLPPRTYCQPGVGIVYNGSAVSVGFSFGLAANCYTFVPVQHFCNVQPRNYCVAPTQVTQIYNQTKVINNIKINGNGNNVVINNGIAVQNVAAASQTPIRQVPVHTIDRSFMHDGHKQSFDNASQTVVAGRPNSNRNAGGTVTPSAPTHTAPAMPSAVQNPPHTTGIFGNGNNHPAQNHIQQPVVNQNLQPNQTVTAPQTTPSQFSRVRTQTDRNNTVAPVPQNPPPVANYHSPSPSAPVQTPPSNYNPLPATAHWPQPETPRNYGHNAEARQNVTVQNPVTTPPANYSAPQPSHQQNFNQSRSDTRQNYSQPSGVAAPQQNAPAAQPSSQSGGGRNGNNGNQIWGLR
jgi:hypothetical protein